MNLRPYKFIVSPVVQETDENGSVLNERTLTTGQGEPFILFGIETLIQWAKQFTDNVRELEQREFEQ